MDSHAAGAHLFFLRMSHALINIGEVLVHGILFDPKNVEAWQNMETVQNIYRAVPALFDLLDERGVQYALVGDIAMLAYVEGRNTQDIDLIIDRDDVAKLREIRIESQNAELPAVGSAICAPSSCSRMANCSTRCSANMSR